MTSAVTLTRCCGCRLAEHGRRHPKHTFLSLLELPNQIKIVELSPTSSHFDCIINGDPCFPFLTKSKSSLRTTTSSPPRRRRKSCKVSSFLFCFQIETSLSVLQGFSLRAFASFPDLFPVDEGVMGGGGCSGKMVDRISNLSDEVVHRILSFLVIKDLTRFGCVSKRSRELYLSAPSLDFDVSSGSCIYVSPFEKRLKLFSSLDRFLFIHREVNKIQRFRISWCSLLPNREQELYFSDDVRFRVITWIHNAVRCKVEVLEVVAGFFMVRRYSLPSSVFLCGSLRSLLLTRGCTILKAPSLASSSNLEYLKLDDVFIEDEGFFKWISCSCKCIKELHLEDIFGINQITIESSSLKSFSFVLDSPVYVDFFLSISAEKLEDILVHLDLHNCIKNLVNIFAPNLKYLKLSGDDVWIGQSLGKSTSLEKAEFFLESDRRCFKVLSKVLSSINKVETLVLNRETTTAVFYGDFMPLLLENVCYLSIHVGSFRDMLVPGMVSTFQGMCNLSTLEIKSDPEFFEPKTDCSGFNMGYWRLQYISFIHQLKEVTIELSIGSNGIQFAKYVLEHAQNLKKMTVFHAPQQSKAVRKITKSKIASSAKLVFLEDRERG